MPVNSLPMNREGDGWAVQFQVADGQTSPDVEIPAGADALTANLHFGGGVVPTLSYSTSGRAALESGSAVFVGYAGAITSGEPVVFNGRVTAIRVAASGGSVDAELLA